jgi:hypothetical protein
MRNKYARVFSGKEGEEVLRDILLASGVEKDNFNADPYQNAMNCGMRRIGLHIKHMSDVSPKDVKKPELATR